MLMMQCSQGVCPPVLLAATLFLWFLNNNRILYRPDGSKRIADNTLVALTLMVAESRTEEKDVTGQTLNNINMFF